MTIDHHNSPGTARGWVWGVEGGGVRRSVHSIQSVREHKSNHTTKQARSAHEINVK